MATRMGKVTGPGGFASRVPQVLQMEALECGAAYLALVCAYYGKWIPLEQVRSDCGVSRDGSNALNMIKAARSYGLEAHGYRYEPKALRERGTFPCIVHFDFNHFVVVRGFKGDCVFINDPGAGEEKLDLAEFDRRFTGVVLMFKPAESFEPGGKPASIKDFALERLRGAKAILAFVAITSAIGALMGLVSPIMSQVFTDRLLTGKNLSWTVPFLVLFFIFGVINVTVQALNAIYLRRVEGKMAASASAAFLWKVLHMPMEFFSQRLAGDIARRMGSNATVAQSLAAQVGPLLINIAMVVVYLALMIAYSPLLTAVSLASMAVNVLVARAVSRRRVNATRVMMRDSANLASTTMAGISMIETIKAQGVEPGFFKRWAGYQASVNKINVRNTRITQGWGLIPSIVNTVSNGAILSIGVWLIIQGRFTVGSLLAMQSFVSGFTSPASSLVGVMQTMQEMRTDMERIKDVMDYRDDPLALPRQDTTVDAPLEKLSGEVELDHVTFGYSKLADPVIRDLCLHVAPGGCVALVGPSGCGKSTIAKLIAGLYEPWSGEIRLDGMPLGQIPRAVRCGSVAVIDQDIVLYRDTIGNNIRLWDSTIEDYEVILAARDAQIHDDIMAREGAYESMLAEDGRDLSGGQRQRLEIARALAMDPTVIVMDEATSALDAQTEAAVMEAVRRRGVTLVVVAHRLSTVRGADEIIVLDQGVAVERGTHEELIARNGAYTHLITGE